MFSIKNLTEDDTDVDGPVVCGALGVALSYCVINFVLQTLVQPRFVSSAVHLSLTLTFASVIVWATIIGPLGAVLAVPLTLFFRMILLGDDPRSAWARWLTGARAELEPPITPTG